MFVTLFCCLFALTLFSMAAWSDRKYRIIDNTVSIGLVILFMAWSFNMVIADRAPASFVLSHILTAALVFVIGFGLWLAGFLGGGDAKLASAAALWAGTAYVGEMMVIITMAGAVISISLLLLSKWLPQTAQIIFGQSPAPVAVSAPAGGVPGEQDRNLGVSSDGNAKRNRLSEIKAISVPYGIAIACGGFYAVAQITTHYGLS